MTVLFITVVTVIGKCSKCDLTSKTGVINSPSYPDEYVHDEDCVYSITGGENTYINLTILHFDLYEVNIYKCRGISTYDYLEVRDGDSMASPLIAIFCGSDKPTSLHSTQNKLWIRYMEKGSKTLFTNLSCIHMFLDLNRTL